MVKFVPKTPVVQPDPQVKVDVTAADPLPLGVNRFQLIVVDDAGNESEPAFLEVVVRDRARPTAVLQIVDGNGSPISPAEVPFGSSFILSAEKSSDVAPGKVVEYRFTLMPVT
ncbi:MAG: hypothetical protein V4466_11490 [Pseudomonadota bacterium]